MTVFTSDSLSIHLKADGFSFFSRDNKKTQIVKKGKLFEAMSNTMSHSPKKISEEIISFMGQEKIAYSKKINLIFTNNLFTLVPNELYDESKTSTYIEFNHFLLPDDPIETKFIQDLGIRFLFGYNENIEQKIKKKLSETQVTITHSGEQLIRHLSKLSPEKNHFVYLNSSSIEIIFFDNRQLTIYNYFEVKAKEDILYYILFVSQQLDINLNKTPIFLVGDTALWADAVEMMKKYIRYVELGLNEHSIIKENLF